MPSSSFSGTQSLKGRDPTDEGQRSGWALGSRGASHAKLATLSPIPGTHLQSCMLYPTSVVIDMCGEVGG